MKCKDILLEAVVKCDMSNLYYELRGAVDKINSDHHAGGFYRYNLCLRSGRRENLIITSLEGSPKHVSGNYSMISTKDEYTSLVGGPREVDGDFIIEGHHLISLSGAPVWIGGTIRLTAPKMTSLHNVHKYFKQMNVGSFQFDMPLQKQVLGLLLIDGINDVYNFRDDNVQTHVCAIINKYLPNHRGMAAVNECQDELIEAGFENYAEL